MAEGAATTVVVVQLAERGALGLVGMSPALALPAWQMLDVDSGPRMREVLNEMLREIRAVHPAEAVALGRLEHDLERMLDEARSQGIDVAPSLGLEQQRNRQNLLGVTDIDWDQAVAARAVALEAEAYVNFRRTPGVVSSEEEYTDAQAEFIACSAALSLYARGATRLTDNLLTVPGGLLMPGLTVVLLTRYASR